jgi:hypothetical protein
MQLRINRTTRNGKTYQYAQLVESYRRESDGMPVHRVVASLGALSPLELQNLRTSLQAAREKKRVVIARKAAPTAPPKVLANLRYLDLAVLLELWRECGLADLLGEILPQGAAGVPAATVVAALVLQRCLDPGSKLQATRWFPGTALPELTAVVPDAFNNTRIHRVLDELDASHPELMAKLPRHLAERDGAFVSLFLDTTDTWFVGSGPPLAASGKTKEGLVQQKIGIALLCSEKGYPLRWETVCGSSADCTVMGGMFRSLSRLSWVGQAPVICDRAMGHTAQLVEMDQSGLRYLTAMTAPEMCEYAPGLPHKVLAKMQPGSSSAGHEELARLAAEAATAAEAAGMHRASDDLLFMDAGTIEREIEPAKSAAPAARAAGTGQQALRLAQQARALVGDGQCPSSAAAARSLGVSKALLVKYNGLLGLSEELQRELAAGALSALPLAKLLRIARLAAAEQREAIAALARRVRAPAPQEPAQPSPAPHKLKVRVTAYFNPQLFADKRLTAQRRLDEIRAFVDELNVKLQSPRARRTKLSAAAAVDRKLRSYNLVEAFAVTVDERKVADRTVLHVTATLDEEGWALRRRTDGFTVLVAHPGLTHAPLELCRLYRDKDVVEKDFQVIKSTVELRPVRHQTDAKVRAHVTICMLALLLERRLTHRLAGHRSAQAALEILRGCHLNRFASDEDGEPVYALTELTSEQRSILSALGMRQLAAQEDIVDRISPR